MTCLPKLYFRKHCVIDAIWIEHKRKLLGKDGVRKGNPQADLLFNMQCTQCYSCHRLVEKDPGRCP